MNTNFKFIPECPKEKVFIASMNVQSLYQNIHHKEGNDFCRNVADRRTNQLFPISYCNVDKTYIKIYCNVVQCSFNVTIYLHKQNLLFHNLIYTGNMPVTSSDVLLKEIASWHNRINWQQKCLKQRQKILYATKVKKISMHSFCDYTVSETRDCPQSNLLCLQGCSKKVLQNFLGTFKEPLIVAYRRPQNLMSHSHKTDILTNSSLKMYLRWNLKHLSATVSSMA